MTSTANRHPTGHLLYPFANASHIAAHPPLRIDRASGCHVFDQAGKRYLDGQGGLWNVNVGHDHPEIKEAITQQLNQLGFYSIFGGTTTQPAMALAERLCRMTEPEGMSAAFFSSGGSEANEAAFKLTRQYWRQCGEPERHKIISLKQAYHGVTLGALSANGSTAYRQAYEPLLAGFSQVDTPHLYRNPYTDDSETLGRLCAQLLEREILHQGPGTVAAFIAEPVQGAGGVIVPPPNYWPLVREVCDRYRVLLIADEVVTGFGRIGNLFGSRHWGVKPDIMVFAKGINSGYIPLGATLMNQRVESAFHSSDARQFSPAAFYHGNTYAGHPLACAAALANLEIIERENLTENAAKVGGHLLERLKSIKGKHPYMGDVRGLGLMIGVELVADPVGKQPFDLDLGFGAYISDYCRRHGVLIRNLADTFIISPPLTLSMEQAELIANTFEQAIEAAEKALLR
ncbi:aminotransferase class III-fold pyridoxal phosphate-dependent enzyme [Chromobacterium haemolyticum]|uniref:aminotransferase class III-fold pyridoxal phosphate-dependent enzyme n=1 Tax=Chromobacterium TaxID=535 RepID=UPI004057A33A